MIFFLRFLSFIAGLVIGLLILKYREQIVYTFGKSEWAESRFGVGGSYTLWQFIGVIVILAGVVGAFFI